jgi:fructosamine-3-kinase
MSLPSSFLVELECAIKANLGSSLTIRSSFSVSGGDINQAQKLELSDGSSLFLKFNSNDLPNLFETEAAGLELLAETQTIRIPKVIASVEASTNNPACLILEWIESSLKSDGKSMRNFGQNLAHLHEVSADYYGLDRDNYIGSLPQSNGQNLSWIEFYRDKRLGEQAELAKEFGLLPPQREKMIDKLRANLNKFISESEISPALLHGDLWGGNYLITKSEAVLIDPAVYFGHSEVDVAMTELFGGFSGEFYQGYDEIRPLPPEYDDRRLLYQLYPILVHLNFFGGTYGAKVDSILKHYVG